MIEQLYSIKLVCSSCSNKFLRVFHVSDSHAHETFDRYIKLDRLHLTDAISVDEVHLDMDDDYRYALVIQDFQTDDPISGMYNAYIAYVEKYFPNAVPVVGSFHRIQWSTCSIDNHIRQLLKKYRQRDREYPRGITFIATILY